MDRNKSIKQLTKYGLKTDNKITLTTFWQQIWRRKGENGNALRSHWRSLDWCGLQFLLSVNFWATLNHLPVVSFLLAQTDMAVCHSWRNFNKIMPFSSGIILCSHLFMCFCTGSTDLCSNGCVQVTSAFRSFRSLSSFN